MSQKLPRVTADKMIKVIEKAGSSWCGNREGIKSTKTKGVKE